jgi:hypothetical protein
MLKRVYAEANYQEMNKWKQWQGLEVTSGSKKV